MSESNDGKDDRAFEVEIVWRGLWLHDAYFSKFSFHLRTVDVESEIHRAK